MEEVIEVGTTKDGATVELDFAFYPEYFMDDFVEGDQEVPKPYLLVKLGDDEGASFFREPAEVEQLCGAKIIGYEYDEPIENSFSILN
jgi:hypothetical protein